MHTLFISDLHLSLQTPIIAKNFIELLEKQKNELDALYILGDLFEYWLGDDGITSTHQPIIHAIKQISDCDIPVYFIHGNRDFLISDEFAKQTGAKLLDDIICINLYNKPTLIMHGDLLCTDDHAYLQFREQVHNKQWQTHFLSLTMQQRTEMAQQARDASEASMKGKSSDIMDANQSSIEQLMAKHQVDTLIHGHTHRPNVHQFTIGSNSVKRIVLGDWGDKASFLTVSATDYNLSDSRVN